MSESIDNARAWLKERGWGGSRGLAEIVVAYGAHCASEAEAERDAAIAAVGDMRAALTTVRASLTGMRIAWRETCDKFHVPASSMHEALGQSFVVLEKTNRISDATPREALVKAAVELAEAYADAWVKMDGDVPTVAVRNELRAYREAKEGK